MTDMNSMARAVQSERAANDAARQALYEQLFSGISEVSSLPAQALRIFEVASDPEADTEDLQQVVEADPALAARVLRTANSAYYGLRRKVVDLYACIMLLGFKEVRNLAMTIYVAGLFRETAGHGPYSRSGLWRHLVSTGTVARLLCKRIRRAAADDAYLAGLLHDLGLILIDQYLHPRFCSIVDQLNEQTPNVVVERAVLGFDHCQLGGRVAEKWRFPESIVSAIRFHHDPADCADAHIDVLHCVALADYICHSKGISSLGVINGQCPDDSVFRNLGIDKEELSLLWPEVDEALARADAVRLVSASKA